MSSPGAASGMSRAVLPLVLFLAISGIVFALAKLHLARPGLPKTPVVLGDFYNGQTVFNQKCAPCHGQDGKKGTVGPTLVGDAITLAAAKAQIDNGSGVMPPKLVVTKQENDVMAFLATILAKP